MRDLSILQQKGKGRATYYIADSGFTAPLIALSTPLTMLTAPVEKLTAPVSAITDRIADDVASGAITPVDDNLVHQLPEYIQLMINGLGKMLAYEKAMVKIDHGGLLAEEPKTDYGRIDQEVATLPDIVSYLQNETQLTRKSIVEILKGCTSLKFFKVNPQKFIEGCIAIINTQMRLHIVDGIGYSKIGDNEVYSQELFENEQLTGYLKSNMRTSTKSPYEYVVYDSGVESELTSEFERNTNIKVYAKLPSWFKIDTPLGTYNPDWAVLIGVDGSERLYFILESKGTMGYEFLRPTEQGKIECGKAHFKELVSLGSNIKMEHIANMEDFINKVLI